MPQLWYLKEKNINKISYFCILEYINVYKLITRWWIVDSWTFLWLRLCSHLHCGYCSKMETKKCQCACHLFFLSDMMESAKKPLMQMWRKPKASNSSNNLLLHITLTICSQQLSLQVWMRNCDWKLLINNLYGVRLVTGPVQLSELGLLTSQTSVCPSHEQDGFLSLRSKWTFLLK